MVVSFDPWPPLLGGALIGLSAILLMSASGRIAGVSGILGRVVAGALPQTERVEAIAFFGGLLAAPWALAAATGHPRPLVAMASLATMAVAGCLVGIGATLANGCTSGTAFAVSRAFLPVRWRPLQPSWRWPCSPSAPHV